MFNMATVNEIYEVPRSGASSPVPLVRAFNDITNKDRYTREPGPHIPDPGAAAPFGGWPNMRSRTLEVFARDWPSSAFGGLGGFRLNFIFL